VTDASAELLTEIRQHFVAHAEDADDSAETGYHDAGASGPFAVVVPSSRYRLFPLLVNQGNDVLLVGTIAVVATAAMRVISPSFLTDLGQQLFQAGDVGAYHLTG